MNNDVWYGAAVSVPIGIATGLAVDPIKRWWINLGQSRALVRKKQVGKLYTEALQYRLNPDDFTHYLLQVSIRTVLLGAAMSVFGGAFFALTEAADLGHMGFVIGQIVTIFGSVLIVKICVPALSVSSRVIYFEKFAETVPDEFRSPTLEGQAVGRRVWAIGGK